MLTLLIIDCASSAVCSGEEVAYVGSAKTGGSGSVVVASAACSATSSATSAGVMPYRAASKGSISGASLEELVVTSVSDNEVSDE